MRERATELEFLKWFYRNLDLGPGESDVTDGMKSMFMDQTGKDIPEGYNVWSDGETKTDETTPTRGGGK